MGIGKGLLVVLASYAVVGMARTYPLLISPVITSGPFGSPSPGLALLLIPLTLVTGLTLWFARTFIANQLSKRVFKTKAGFREELGDFGFAHFPLIFAGLSSMIVFVFGLSNIGIFASLFLGMFFSLLMYAFFVNVVMSHHNMNWKKALMIITITEAVLFATMFLIGLAALHPLMQSSLMSMMTI